MALFPVALGVGLLAGAVAVSATRARSDGDLDWSNYAVGLGATAVLLLVALLGLLAGEERREELATLPGAVGILGTGLMLGVGLEDAAGSDDWLAYLIGGVVFVLSVGGYAAVRRGAFMVTAIVGLGVAYLQLADDVLVDIGDKDDQAIIAAATIAVFVLAVTAVGWLFRTRALTGVVAGVVGVVGLNAVLAVLAVSQLLSSIFGGGPGPMFGDDPSTDGAFGAVEESVSGGGGYDDDVYVVLVIAAVLTLLWALAAAVNGNPGFGVLAVAMPATVVPLATFVLVVEHPTWWGVGLAAAGALLLALAVVGLRGRRKPGPVV